MTRRGVLWEAPLRDADTAGKVLTSAGSREERKGGEGEGGTHKDDLLQRKPGGC